MGLLGGSRNSVQSSSASTPASSRHSNNHNNYRHRRAESDVTDSSSTGSIDNVSSDNSNTNSLKSTPPSLPRSQSLRRQSSQQFLRYECRDAPHFELREDPYYTTNANVKVMIRIRPLSADEIVSNGYWRCIRQESAHSLTWLGHPETRFSFDHVASESVTQEEVFNVVGAPMVENCLAGYNSCMFAYGQTGSGKTHTILGVLEGFDGNLSEGRGLTPRIIEHLFARIQQDERINESLKYSCKCSFLEIYNEQVTDLLEPTSTNLLVREDHKRGVYVENLTEVDVMSVQDAITLLRKGTANRKVAVTIMNKESSRSHSIFTCSVQCRNGSLNKTLYGLLHLVDLAGSERQKLSGAEGGRLKEATNINKSLSTLGLVIMNLVDIANGKQRHVPYRDSKLTFLLQDSLGGNSKTTVVANISPSSCSSVETLSTLKFSQRAKFIQNAVVVNEDTTEDISAMRAQIKLLKKELQQAQYTQKASFYSFTTPPRRFNNLHDDSESPSADRTGDFESAYICNGGQIKSSASPLVSSAKCICEGGECSTNCMWKIRSLESIVAGALRRELQSERLSKHLSTEIEYLQCLVRQREDETQCSRMLLRFREEKISKMESAVGGSISSATILSEENKALKEEVKLLRGRIDRNPELIRFAMENIKLIEQIRRYREFYEGGERDVMIEEISNLRDKLAELLDWKQQHELSSGKGLLDLVQMVSNVDKKSWNTWLMCGKTNSQMARHIGEIETHLAHLKKLFSEQQEVINTIKGEPEQLAEEQYKHIDAQF
ncbi:kinesin-like protein KIN-12D isoform X2 [Cryptomeria japonica]|uniref:kinesin-like protein KIN-12D isoform X2 n=1 Tax=Cryptomeria japonica TaxID=3369 RepID=UPI0025AC557B|nr:kinesin-like protein KIN-12D isoform X2 [Cryptomeria japonica]